jgi:hypothetical protein
MTAYNSRQSARNTRNNADRTRRGVLGAQKCAVYSLFPITQQPSISLFTLIIDHTVVVSDM